MPLDDYKKPHDFFEALAPGTMSYLSNDMAFPCCACCYNNKPATSMPCRGCGHNFDSLPPTTNDISVWMGMKRKKEEESSR